LSLKKQIQQRKFIYIHGSIESSYVSLRTEYYIDAKKFNVSNEKDTKIDDYGNYYSEKAVTDGTKAK